MASGPAAVLVLANELNTVAGDVIGTQPAAVQDRQAVQARFAGTIQDGDRQWTADDLTDLRNALRLLNARELAFLRGFQLFRFSNEAARGQRIGNPLRLGDPGGLTELTNDLPPRVARITIFDEGLGRAQTHEGVRSTQRTQHGGVRMGVYTMLHEFGHTIEGSGRFRPNIMTEFERLLTHAQQPITDGPQSRGTDPREKYCEGFARFHVDRNGLAERSTGIVAFFASGRHLP
jgi:hypothetical protein